MLHPALRHSKLSSFPSAGEDVMPEVRAVRAQMRQFSDKVRSGLCARLFRGGPSGMSLTSALVARILVPRWSFVRFLHTSGQDSGSTSFLIWTVLNSRRCWIRWTPRRHFLSLLARLSRPRRPCGTLIPRSSGCVLRRENRLHRALPLHFVAVTSAVDKAAGLWSTCRESLQNVGLGGWALLPMVSGGVANLRCQLA